MTIEGEPRAVYHSGIKTFDLLTEASHIWVIIIFSAEMFALSVDLRSTFSNNEYGNGRNTLGASIITFKIKKDPELSPNENLRCHAYACDLNLSTQGFVM